MFTAGLILSNSKPAGAKGLVDQTKASIAVKVFYKVPDDRFKEAAARRKPTRPKVALGRP